MGHKDDLLAGAKKCLLEKGYGHTTARDIVEASGTNLASIGYHFGSKDALLAAAMMALMEEWGDKFESGRDAPPETTSLARFEGIWGRLYSLFDADRALLIASFEIIAQIDRLPELRAVLAGAHEELRRDFAKAFLLIADGEVDTATMRAVSSVLLALMSGIISQYLIDPDRAPTREELVTGLRFIVGKLET